MTKRLTRRQHRERLEVLWAATIALGAFLVSFLLVAGALL